MKKLLILIVAFALFLHFYPQPQLESWFNQQLDTTLEKVSTATDTKARLKSEKVLIDLTPDLLSFSIAEQDYLKELTSTRTAVKNFYFDTCKGEKVSSIFHPVNQTKVCKAISKYSNML